MTRYRSDKSFVRAEKQHHSGAVQAAQNQQGGFHEVIGHAQLKLHNVLPSRAGERAFLCFGVREEACKKNGLSTTSEAVAQRILPCDQALFANCQS